MIRHHHERFDGRGYPDGLNNGKIPLLARVIAVADTYDAMTSERPYRPALSTEIALAEIKRCSGTQFDPEIARPVRKNSTFSNGVQAFLELDYVI
ncbi:MAG: HD domain-containing protein [Elusimicrobia bacterium]|nr:HD domain-containing protein [Elusimicrobiota bacterium]